MSPLVDFYRGDGPDTEGRYLEDILSWSDADLEEVHDYIQWLFPLATPSNFNPDAPLLTREEIAIFRADPGLRRRLRRSYDRFLAFLGLAENEQGQVVDGPHLAERSREVWAYFNHNWLRVTRVLTSLNLLGLEREGQALFRWLDDAWTRRRFPIPGATYQHWKNASTAVPPG